MPVQHTAVILTKQIDLRTFLPQIGSMCFDGRSLWMIGYGLIFYEPVILTKRNSDKASRHRFNTIHSIARVRTGWKSFLLVLMMCWHFVLKLSLT